MRIALFVPAAMLLAACSVNEDEQNGTTTVAFDQEAAENGVEAAANQAGEIAGHIANDVSETADKVQNGVRNVDVPDVDVDVDAGGDADANAQ